MISAGLISAALGSKLPGYGTIYLGQTMFFNKPVFLGDTITAELEVVKKIEKAKFTLLKIHTICRNQDNEITFEGIATVMPPKK